MKKSILILAIVLVLTFTFAMSASATQPEHVSGYVPLSSYIPGPEYEEYDLCDPVIVGHVVQPAAPPGFAIHGTFTAGNIPDPDCPYTTELSGTCEATLVPVEQFGNPESKEGRGVIGRCTDDLQGLHARFVVHYDFTYESWFHWDP